LHVTKLLLDGKVLRILISFVSFIELKQLGPCTVNDKGMPVCCVSSVNYPVVRIQISVQYSIPAHKILFLKLTLRLDINFLYCLNKGCFHSCKEDVDYFLGFGTM
jgi:hypothetical protein